jgi:hypothetical protein
MTSQYSKFGMLSRQPTTLDFSTKEKRSSPSKSPTKYTYNMSASNMQDFRSIMRTNTQLDIAMSSPKKLDYKMNSPSKNRMENDHHNNVMPTITLSVTNDNSIRYLLRQDTVLDIPTCIGRDKRKLYNGGLSSSKASLQPLNPMHNQIERKL